MPRPDTREVWILTYDSGRRIRILASDEAEARSVARLYSNLRETLETVAKEAA